MQMQDTSLTGRRLFKGRDTSWGIFYPTDYLIAIFDSLDAATRAREALRSAGYSDDEVDAVSSDYVVADIEAGMTNASLLTRIKQGISKAFGTEAEYWMEDLRYAKDGAGFLAVRAPTDEEAQRVLRVVRPMQPKKARRYGKLGVEELLG